MADQTRWAIYQFHPTPACYLGTVEAADEAEAIAVAIERLDVQPAHLDRLIAHRMGD